ncbi:hypothetical protein ACQPYK_50060 (plasmid) [Streptosporangium sp. CA-135522]|uniref:hypothetical protein n=1 Tax=Streptosporangium sp. CA-135522 TaxID=3240072 RepID=UPI003D930F6E
MMISHAADHGQATPLSDAADGVDAGLLAALDHVMAREPQLSWLGFDLAQPTGHGRRPARLERQFQHRRVELRQAAPTVLKIHNWLRETITPIATPTRPATPVRHLAQAALDAEVYLGELVAAALIAGYPMRCRGRDVWFGMSRRDVDRASR